MLLVTFHGGSSGINNICAYLTGGGPQTQPLSTAVLTTTATLSELRAMVASGCLSTTLGNISGLAFDNATPPNSYIAIRTGAPQILIADQSFQNPSAFVATLPDSPEFLLLPNPPH